MKKIISTMFMAIICATILFGCGSSKNEETVTYEPSYYTSEEELPENQYYIAHTETNDEGEEYTIYYPLYNAEANFSNANNSVTGSDPSRLFFLGYQTTEDSVPTFCEGDKMIYKSSTSIPLAYYLEKFYDNGCSFGIAGLYMDSSGNYRYDLDDSVAVTFSDAAEINSLQADSIYFISTTEYDEDGNLKDESVRVDTTRVNTSGAISNLDPGAVYYCDIRTGTEKIGVDLTANVRMLSSAETYLTKKFEFITDYIVEVEMPEYLTNGYHTINNSGLFRIVKEGKTIDDLTEQDYNETIYKYDEDNNIVGTTNGYYLSEDNTLIKGSSATDDDSIDSAATDDEGNYIGTFTAVVVADPVTYADYTAYKISMQDTLDSTNIVTMLYKAKPSETAPKEGDVYTIVYKASTETDAQYEIVSMEKM